MNRLTALYKQQFGTEPTTIQPITPSGSPRQYYRLSSETHSVIGTIGTSFEENRAFIGLTRHFEAHHLPVPHILGVSPDGMTYLQTDLGSTTLYDAISSGRENQNYTPQEEELLNKTIALLPHFQTEGAEQLDITLCYPTPRMDAQSIMFDLNYFKYCFLKLLDNVDFNEISLQTDLDKLCRDITELSQTTKPTLILRDFQARNVMLTGSQPRPHLIDYQGSRLGPAEYDLASFLWQSSAHYSTALRERLINTYINEAITLRPTNARQVRQGLRLIVLFRLLQVLGAYGYRGLHQRKPYFLSSIPAALDNMRQHLLTGAADDYPYLKNILETLTIEHSGN